MNDEVPAAINFLGSCYQLGHLGLQRSSRRAVRFFRRAARLGNVLALVNLGAELTTAYYAGGTYDSLTVRECYRKLADMGHYEHLFAAYCIQEKNYEEGIRLYLSAANQGWAMAQFYVFFDPDPSTYGMQPTHGIAPFLRMPPDGIASEKCNAGEVFIAPWDYEAQVAEARRWFVRASLNGYFLAKTALESKKKA